MKLQKRERYLLGAVGGLFVLCILAVLMMFGDPRSDESLRQDRDKYELELKKKQSELDRETEHARQLADWQRRSLPSDRNFAQTLYYAWLSDVCKKANLQNPELHSQEGQGQLRAYTRVPITIVARASLDQIVDFLYRFYSAGHLHQIRRLEIKPTLAANARDFELHVSVEALSLPDAKTKDKLSTEAGHSLQLAQEAAYRKEISGRDFFAVYTPTRTPPGGQGMVISGTTPPVPPIPPRKVDPAKFAEITGFTQVDGSPRVWLRDHMKGKLWQLGEGDKFLVGGGTGQIGRIDPDGEVTLHYDGALRSLHAGDYLREDKELKK